jgi:Domain of unknown function (DUF4126)
VHLAFDIFQGIGISAAVGIRPFLPALIAGALAAAGVEIHFNGTDFAFLQSVPFLIGMGAGGAALLIVERELGRRAVATRSVVVVAAAFGLALGALFFAGSLARGHYTDWPGFLGGVVCAAVAVAATAPLLARVSARLGGEDASALPFYAEGAGILVGLLSIVAPPLGVIALLFLVWLLVAGRRREGQKYAGLRILR